MRRPLVLLSLLAASLFGLLLAGCDQADDSTPVACREGSGPYLHALRAAPGEVALDDGTPISGCLVENQQGGDLATVGTALVVATTKLNAAARAEPGGGANLQLGYLLGAATHGAEGTNGVHAELVRRLTAAARYSPDGRPLPAAFLRTYREGFDAGAAHG
jgi:FAD/FMN-containing dehydrogenase